MGNKTDLNDKREVTTQQGEEEAKRQGLRFVETSAKLGHNVQNLFKRIAQALPGMEGSDAAAQATNQSKPLLSLPLLSLPISTSLARTMLLRPDYSLVAFQLTPLSLTVIDVRTNTTAPPQEGCSC